MEAPEKIWAWANAEVNDQGGWNLDSVYDGAVDEVQYTRSDLVPQWQPIETAPLNVPILVCGGLWEGEINGSESYSHAMVVETNNRHAWVVAGTDAYSAWIVNPTHWMPLPKPPEGV